MKRLPGTYTFDPRHTQSTYLVLLRAAETINTWYLLRYLFSNKKLQNVRVADYR
jgi:hypothetical protein